MATCLLRKQSGLKQTIVSRTASLRKRGKLLGRSVRRATSGRASFKRGSFNERKTGRYILIHLPMLKVSLRYLVTTIWIKHATLADHNYSILTLMNFLLFLLQFKELVLLIFLSWQCHLQHVVFPPPWCSTPPWWWALSSLMSPFNPVRYSRRVMVWRCLEHFSLSEHVEKRMIPMWILMKRVWTHRSSENEVLQLDCVIVLCAAHGLNVMYGRRIYFLREQQDCLWKYFVTLPMFVFRHTLLINWSFYSAWWSFFYGWFFSKLCALKTCGIMQMLRNCLVSVTK